MNLTIQGGITRGKNVYRSGVPDERKRSFKKFIKQKLIEYARIYKTKNINSQGHIKNIEKFANVVTVKFGSILNGNRFNIGRSQKLLNLYLKYQWVLGEMQQWKTQRPPHCPFDSKVVQRLRKVDAEIANWTELDSTEGYLEYIEAAEVVLKNSGYNSLAEWELAFWKNR